MVNGPGMGVNLGLGGEIAFQRLIFGADGEVIKTNCDYSATTNCSRLGLFLGLNLYEWLNVNYHFGNFHFQTTRDIDFHDDLTNDPYTLLANKNYSGSFTGISLDFVWGDYIITPKVLINYIQESGAVREFDINIGRKF